MHRKTCILCHELRINVGLETGLWRHIVTSQTAHNKYKWIPYATEWTPPMKIFCVRHWSRVSHRSQTTSASREEIGKILWRKPWAFLKRKNTRWREVISLLKGKVLCTAAESLVKPAARIMRSDAVATKLAVVLLSNNTTKWRLRSSTFF